MALRELPLDELNEERRGRAEKSIAVSGDALFYRTLMNSPEALEWLYEGFYPQVFYGGKVPVRIKELARFRLAQLHVCGHCMRYDIASLREHGVTEEEILAVADYENGPFSDGDKALLHLTDILAYTEPEGHVDDELMAELQSHFTDGEIMEFAMVVAVITGSAKMMFAFDLAEKDNACLLAVRGGNLTAATQLSEASA